MLNSCEGIFILVFLACFSILTCGIVVKVFSFWYFLACFSILTLNSSEGILILVFF